MDADVCDYCLDHDIFIIWTVAGASEIDQVADCGVMACLQNAFGDALSDWRDEFVGCELEQPDWNKVFWKACLTVRIKKMDSILSAWKKTGWFPFVGVEASNYQQDGIMLHGVTLDPKKGGARMREAIGAEVKLRGACADLQGDAPCLVLASDDTDDSNVIIKAAAYNALAKEVDRSDHYRQERQKIEDAKQIKVPSAAKLARDAAKRKREQEEGWDPSVSDTSHACVLDANVCHQRRLVKNRAEDKVKDKAESAERSKRQKLETQQAAMIAGAVIERKLAAETVALGELKVDDLKALIRGRGGQPRGKKAEMQAAAAALEPMSAAALAMFAAVVEHPVVADDGSESESEEEEEPEPEPAGPRRSRRGDNGGDIATGSNA